MGLEKRAECSSAQTSFGTRAAAVFEQARSPDETHEKKGHQHLVPNAFRCKSLLPESQREPRRIREAAGHVLHRPNKTRQ
jgi:hypothetical protein